MLQSDQEYEDNIQLFKGNWGKNGSENHVAIQTIIGPTLQVVLCPQLRKNSGNPVKKPAKIPEKYRKELLEQSGKTLDEILRKFLREILSVYQ